VYDDVCVVLRSTTHINIKYVLSARPKRYFYLGVVSAVPAYHIYTDVTINKKTHTYIRAYLLHRCATERSQNDATQMSLTASARFGVEIMCIVGPGPTNGK
jgi:hypothetical protein